MEVNKKKEKISKLIVEISDIIDRALALEESNQEALSKVHSNFLQSARNLIHYRALRMKDIRSLQKKLGNMGLSRLAKSDSHVMASLLSNKSILEGFLNGGPITIKRAGLTFKKSARLEKTNAKSLLGYRSKGRLTRIMVTVPSEVSHNYQMAYDMIASGMNCARINCAHDDATVWKQMIDHIRIASQKLKRKCKIMMDLGGPKIRTGPLTPGPKVRKFRPTKNIRGKVIAASEIWLGQEAPTNAKIAHLPITWKNLDVLEEGDRLFFKDARKKKREFTITKVNKKGCFVQSFKTAYLETGIGLHTNAERSSYPIKVGEIPPVEQAIILHSGEFLRLHRAKDLGESALFDKDNTLINPAHLSCTSPEIFNSVKVNEPIFFDDGKIEGIIRETNSEEMLIEIMQTKANGGKLKADKGINLPSSDLNINGLTEKDKRDLIFVAQHADVVNLSFVNRPQDIKDLFAELKKLNAPKKLGIILKIETQSGFNNLTNILLEGMQSYPLGVMIARGDLAIECGWDNIGRVQEEIMSLCQAANVPDVWATQVLENLAKEGIPSRAEITDATMAQRTDCVMLNKGPYILQSIKLLDTILKDMAPYHEKKTPMLPMMEEANIHKG